MYLSTRTRYSVRALLYLARKGKNTPVSVSEIAREESIPRVYLERLLNRLKKEGLVGSFRGRKGGYYLLHAPQEITLEKILRATGEDFPFVDCLNDRRGCPRKSYCPAFNLWKTLQERFHKWLKELTLRDFLVFPEGSREISHNYIFHI